MVKTLIANTAKTATFAFAILALVAIHTNNAQKSNVKFVIQTLVAKTLNVEKRTMISNVFVVLDLPEIHSLDVMILTNAMIMFAVKMLFVLIQSEVMIVGAKKIMLEIHLLCVRKSKVVFVKIVEIAIATIECSVQVVSLASKANVKILVKKLNVVHVRHVMTVNVYVRQIISEIQTICAKDV